MLRSMIFLSLLLSAAGIGGASLSQLRQASFERRMLDLENRVVQQQSTLNALTADVKLQKAALDSTIDLTSLLVKKLDQVQQKPKASGWVDCWTSRDGRRNCVDAQGNSSSRNF